MTTLLYILLILAGAALIFFTIKARRNQNWMPVWICLGACGVLIVFNIILGLFGGGSGGGMSKYSKSVQAHLARKLGETAGSILPEGSTVVVLSEFTEEGLTQPLPQAQLEALKEALAEKDIEVAGVVPPAQPPENATEDSEEWRVTDLKRSLDAYPGAAGWICLYEVLPYVVQCKSKNADVNIVTFARLSRQNLQLLNDGSIAAMIARKPGVKLNPKRKRDDDPAELVENNYLVLTPGDAGTWMEKIAAKRGGR